MPPYPLSFTGASLCPHAMADIARAYLKQGDWAATREYVIENDVLTTARNSTAARRLNELVLRLETLSEEEIEFLANANVFELRQMCYIACCRSYPFLRSFVQHVLLPKALSYQYDVRDSDYARWFDQEAVSHPRLNEITESTRDKLKSRSFALLAEAGIIDSARTRNITPPQVSYEIERMIARHQPEDGALFLGPPSTAAISQQLKS